MNKKSPTEETRQKMSIAHQRHYNTLSAAGERRCLKCNILKVFSDFPRGRTRRDGSPRYGYCKKCHGDYQRAARLKNFFLMTVDDADKVFSFQGDVCAICKRPPAGKKRLSLDHRHKDGLVRGGLCNWCNRAIARFGDDIIRLRAAADYLENPPAIQALGREHFARPGRIGTKKQRAAIKREKKNEKN